MPPTNLLLLVGCSPATKLREARAVDLGTRQILVAGGSGRVGVHLVRALQAQGLTFRATTRNLDEARQRLGEEAARVDWVEVDVRDAAQVDAAVRGADMVISVIGSRQVGGENGPEFVDYGGVRNLVDAAVRHGVEHFVLLTAIGVTDPGHPFNVATKGALEWRFRGEEYLRDSGLRYTVVRPAGLVNTPAGVTGVRLEQGDRWQPLLRATLSRADLALVLIETLRHPATARVTFEIAGDAGLPPDGWRQALSTLVPDPAR